MGDRTVTEAEQIIDGAMRREVVDIRVKNGKLSTRSWAHNEVMNRVAALGPFPTSWALVATDDEYELLAARLGVLE